MRFITNKQHGDQIRVQPEYKMTAECSTPIANAEVNTSRRNLQEEILSKLWKNSCECLQLVREYQQAVKSEDFENGDNYDTSVVAWDVFSKLLFKFHQFIHSHYVATSWTEWKSISVDKCDTTSSTSTKEAS
tara:strand:+ start:199 stop:594 length:396 start_codon:yes stop_codon:yes gene_type:complete